MKSMGLKGVVRGRRIVTTNPAAARPCPDDKVNRQFTAQRPNQLWVSDFTYVPTWSPTVYAAFVIDVFARRIVGWRVSTSMSTQLVLDALDQAIFQRKTHGNKTLIHHSDRGSQYLSITYTERLAEAGIDPSVGTVGDSYDNALAECVIGLFKTEVINVLGPWRTLRDVELCVKLGDGGLRRRRIVAGVRSLPEPPVDRYAYDRRYHGHPIPPAWFDH